MEKSRVRLLEEFPTLNREDWEFKLYEECQKVDNEKKLYWKTTEDITVNPYYCASDIGSMPHVASSAVLPLLRKNKKGRNAWEIRQDIIVRDIPAANQKALHMLERGAEAIGFDLREAGNLNYDEFEALINTIDVKRVPLHWTAIENPDYLLDHLRRLTKDLKLESFVIRGSACSDPIGHATVKGGFRDSFENEMSRAGRLISKAGDSFPGLRVIEVNAQHFINAGGSSVHELGYGLAIAAEYFSWFTDRGLTAEKIAGHMQVNLGTGSNYFFEIAKVRAARMLFAGLIRTYDDAVKNNRAVYIQSITSNWNKTVYGSHVNMLRLTTESMAAVLGGCDSLLVKPYDECFREPGHFSERLARNLQVILREESYFDKVADVAGGSYYIESITKSLCEKAWNLFLEIEEKGGYVESFRNGYIQKEIRETANKRIERTACGKEILLGTNAYPEFDEKVPGEINEKTFFYGMPAVPDQIAEPVVETRASTAFEKIRLTIEKHPGKKPEVFMLTYGNLAGRLARSQFSSNFFASAGYQVIENTGFDKPEEGVAEALRRKSDIIVACSSDEEYAGTVPEIHDLIGGKSLLVVAGAPSCMEELKKKGIQYFIYTGSNMIETFQTINKRLGILL